MGMCKSKEFVSYLLYSLAHCQCGLTKVRHDGNRVDDSLKVNANLVPLPATGELSCFSNHVLYTATTHRGGIGYS